MTHVLKSLRYATKNCVMQNLRYATNCLSKCCLHPATMMHRVSILHCELLNRDSSLRYEQSYCAYPRYVLNLSVCFRQRYVMSL
jgi:hypothetical protein